MSLMQLLSVGQSFVRGRNEPSPYKMNQQNLLPKFASVGRPVSLAPAPVAAPALAKAPRDLFRMEQPQSVGAVPALVAKAPSPMKSLSTAGAPANALAAAPAPVGKVVRQPRKRLFGLGSGRSEGRLVQTEMSLDSVKVVCNDLSETDVMIVAPKPVAEAKPQAEPTAMEVVSLWKRWTARLAGVMRTITF